MILQPQTTTLLLLLLLLLPETPRAGSVLAVAETWLKCSALLLRSCFCSGSMDKQN